MTIGPDAFQTALWDEQAKGAVFTHPFDMKTFSSLVPCSGLVLDVGCGYGRIIRELCGSGYIRLIGLDPSEKMIQRGRREIPNVDLKVWNGPELPGPPGSVDAVVLFAVLTCIPRDKAQKNLIHEIEKKLRPGGILYVSDYYLQEDERNRKRYRDHAVEGRAYGVFRLPGGQVFRHLHRAWAKELFSGFETVEQAIRPVFTLKGNRALAFGRFLKKARF